MATDGSDIETKDRRERCREYVRAWLVEEAPDMLGTIDIIREFDPDCKMRNLQINGVTLQQKLASLTEETHILHR